MNQFSMAAQIGLAFPAGIVIGAAYFLSLRWAVDMLAAGEYVKALLANCLRFGLLAAVFFALVGFGAAALLLAALGLLLARQLILRRVRSAS